MHARDGPETIDALRRDVALANRILERMGLAHAFGHASARIPGTNTFLIPTRRSPGFAEAGSLLVIDTEGRLVSGEGEPNSEFWIHARIYAARADAGGIVHAHPPSCVCLTQIGEPHRVVHNQGGIFAGGVPEYSRVGLIRTRELGDLLAQVVGKGNSAMMRGHGITTVFSDLRAATVAACYLEESAALQLRMLASAGGDASRLRPFTTEEAEGLRDQITGEVAKRAWDYFAAVASARDIGGAGRR
jgi:ribulose-5-phosphate 4-epimerase/fuculose-1-phosphate aldolase